MAKFCTYIPNAPNTNNPSRLFTKLQQEFGRQNAIEIWERVSTKEFYNKYLNSNQFALFDENGEATFESILPYINLDNVLSEDQKLKNQEDSLNERLPTTNIDVVKRAVDFNNSQDIFVATVEDVVSDTGKSQMRIKLSTKNDVTSDNAKQLEKALNTYQSIDGFLSTLGISVHILDVDRMHGEDGLLVPTKLKEDTDSIFGVVNIANNIRGFNALPEEFGHFLIECIKDNPIVQRSLNYLKKTPGLIEEILGDEYAAVVDYYEQKGRPDLVEREALGRLIINDINNGRIIDVNPLSQSWLKSKVTNLVSNVKYVFRLKSGEQIQALNAIREAIIPLAKSINTKNKMIDSILTRFKKYGDILAHTKSELRNFQDTFKGDESLLNKARVEIGENLTKFKAIYKNISSMQSTLATLSDSFEKFTSPLPQDFDTKTHGLKPLSDNIDSEAVLQIGEFMDKCITLAEDRFKMMGKLAEMAVDSDYKLILEAASELRMIKDFFDMINNCTPVIYDLLRSLGGLQGDENEVFRQYAKTLMPTFRTLSSMGSQLEDEYLKVGNDLMHTLLLPMFSESGNETLEREGFYFASNKNSMNLADILDHSMGDISGFSRLVNAYYDMGDPYLNLIHYMIRRKQEQVRRNCQEAQNELRSIVADYEAEFGTRDMKWIYERDENGNLTGYYRNLYDIDFNKFYKVQAEVRQGFIDKYGFGTQEMISHMQDWVDQNTREVNITTYKQNPYTGKLDVVTDKYSQTTISIPKPNDAWMSHGPKLTNKQKEYLTRCLEFKNKIEHLLPDHIITRPGAQYYKCIQRTAASATEAVVNGEDGMLKELGNVFKDKFVWRENDQVYGDFNSEDEEETTKSMFSSLKFKHRISKWAKRVYNKYSPLFINGDVLNEDKSVHLSQDELISAIENNQSRIKSRPNDTGGMYYKILEEDGNVYEYERMHSVLGSEYIEGKEPTYSNTESLDAGNTYDSLGRQYFENDININTLQKPSNMTEKAFENMKAYWVVAKKQMQRDGVKFLANNIVLFHKFDDGKRVAGEVDILAIDKDGNLVIYDLKTTRGKISNWRKRDYKTQNRSRYDSYCLQVSGYKDLAELEYHNKVTGLYLIGNELDLQDGMITDHRSTTIMKADYRPEISKMLSITNRLRTRKLPNETTNKEESYNVQTTMGNKEYKRIPMPYLKNIEKSRLSTDFFTCLSEYTEAAYIFNGRHEIADIIDLSVSVAEARKVRRVVDGAQLQERIKAVLGNGASNTYIRLVEQSAQNSNIVEAIKTLRDKHIYGEYQVSSGIPSEGVFSMSKMADMMLRYTSFSMLAYNMFTGINNLVVGKYQTMIEAFAGEYFNYKDWLAAEATVGASMTSFLADYITSGPKTSKLWLVNEMFNIDQNWKKVMENQAFFKSGVMKSLDVLNPSFLMEAGEKNLKIVIGVAMLRAYKLRQVNTKTNEEKEISLWDALTVSSDRDSEGNMFNSRLVLSGGDDYIYIKPDGSKFSFDVGNIMANDDIRDLALKITVVNHRAHGVYNSEDTMAAKRYWVTRLFTMFRNFIPATTMKRFGSSHMNFILKQYEEGFVRTTFRFLGGMIFRHFGEDKLNLSEYSKSAFQQMTKHQQANLRRSLFEVMSIISVWFSLNFGLGGWEDHKGDWENRALYYFMHRLLTEQTFYYNVGSAWEILQSPTPAMGPLNKWMKLFGSVLNPRVLESGPYKGHTNTYAAFMRALPVWWGIADFANLANDDKRFQYMNN